MVDTTIGKQKSLFVFAYGGVNHVLLTLFVFAYGGANHVLNTDNRTWLAPP
jgi:hypothetical protein